MPFPHSEYTRTERLCMAFAQLLKEGWVSTDWFQEATGAPRQTSREDLALLRQFVPLEELEEQRWRLPTAPVDPLDQVAYELGLTRLRWREVAEELGYTSAIGARNAARRYAEREDVEWPPPRPSARHPASSPAPKETPKAAPKTPKAKAGR